VGEGVGKNWVYRDRQGVRIVGARPSGENFLIGLTQTTRSITSESYKGLCLYTNKNFKFVGNFMFKNLVIGLIFTAGVFSFLSDGSIATPLLEVQNPNAYPEADKNGDYYIINGNSGVMPWVWEAVDPEGLNVRCQDRTGPSNRMDMVDLPVDRVMPTGERFDAVGISLDRRGKPWLWVGSHSMSRNRCWVRANKNYVRPIQRINRNL